MYRVTTLMLVEDFRSRRGAGPAAPGPRLQSSGTDDQLAAESLRTAASPRVVDGTDGVFAENNLLLEGPIPGKPFIGPGDYRGQELAVATCSPLGDHL